MHISPLQRSERPRWEQLWLEYQVFYGVNLPADATASTWERLNDGRIHGFGAHDAADRLIGICHFLYHEDTWATARACYLQDLYVDAACRGRGCARQLIAAVATAAQSEGASPPYWLTHETNVVARGLYDKVAINHGYLQYVYVGKD